MELRSITETLTPSLTHLDQLLCPPSLLSFFVFCLQRKKCKFAASGVRCGPPLPATPLNTTLLAIGMQRWLSGQNTSVCAPVAPSEVETCDQSLLTVYPAGSHTLFPRGASQKRFHPIALNSEMRASTSRFLGPWTLARFLRTR